MLNASKNQVQFLGGINFSFMFLSAIFLNSKHRLSVEKTTLTQKGEDSNGNTEK